MRIIGSAFFKHKIGYFSYCCLCWCFSTSLHKHDRKIGKHTFRYKFYRFQGPPGDDGETGAKGDKGQKGDVESIRGVKGEKGDRGNQGPRGESGESGLPGSQGERGEEGEKGVKGDKVSLIPPKYTSRIIKHLTVHFLENFYQCTCRT